MKIVNIDGENLHIFWTTLGILMEFWGNMWLRIILKVTKTRASPLSRRYIFGKTKRWSNWTQVFDKFSKSLFLINFFFFNSDVTVSRKKSNTAKLFHSDTHCTWWQFKVSLIRQKPVFWSYSEFGQRGTLKI